MDNSLKEALEILQSLKSPSGNSESEVCKTESIPEKEHPHRASFEEWYKEEYAFFLRRRRQHYDLVIMEDGEYKWDTPKNAYRIWCACAKVMESKESK